MGRGGLAPGSWLGALEVVPMDHGCVSERPSKRLCSWLSEVRLFVCVMIVLNCVSVPRVCVSNLQNEAHKDEQADPRGQLT